MVRVPLPFRGVAVLLLAASTVVGQTPEPPAELLSLDSVSPSPPDFLRQFSADPRHPLLALMVDGELTSIEATQAQDSSKKLKPEPKSSSSSANTESSEGVIVDDGQLSGLDGGVGGGLLGDGAGGGLLGDGLGGACGLETMCPMAPNMLPFCPPPPCCCRKCQRRCSHRHCGGCGSGGGYGNPYLNWPGCPAWCCYGAPLEPCYQGCGRRRCGHKHGCGGSGYDSPCGGYGYGGGYGGGWDMMGGGLMDGGCGFSGCWMPPPPPQCCGHKCHRHRNRCCGGGGCGYPYGGGGYGGYMDDGWGMGYGGFGGCCMPPPPPPCCGHKRHCRHGCGNYCGGYGYGGGYLCPGWDGGGYGYGCGGHHCGRRGHRHCQQPCSYPMMMPCMGMMSGMGWDSFGAGGMLDGGCDCDGVLGGVIN